jgi:hypothetical protein
MGIFRGKSLKKYFSLELVIELVIFRWKTSRSHDAPASEILTFSFVTWQPDYLVASSFDLACRRRPAAESEIEYFEASSANPGSDHLRTQKNKGRF